MDQYNITLANIKQIGDKQTGDVKQNWANVGPVPQTMGQH